MSDRELAALLLTNRVVDVGVKPFAAGELWDLVERLPQLELLLGRSSVDVAAAAAVAPAQSDRIVRLLAAAAAFAFERERLAESGITLLSAFDSRFPSSWVHRLGRSCPAAVTVAGPIEWLGVRGLGVVGSRDASAEALAVAASTVHAATERTGAERAVVSGLARGVDQAAMSAAYGSVPVIGVPPDGLGVASRAPEVRRRVHRGELCIVSPYAPPARFSAGAAIGRNKLIYGLADVTLVVCAEHGTGGTWAGANESLRRGFGRVAVWAGEGAGPGNAALVALGGHPVTEVGLVWGTPERAAVDEVQDSLF